MRLTATIITRNEEKNIAGCLASLDFADEIIVVDSGSTDRTEEICCGYPKVSFFSRDWPGYGRQKNVAAELASNDWIFSIDADERVTDQLRSSIITAATGAGSAFRVARENYFGQRWVRRCGWYPDYTTRLYDRRRCSFVERSVHESLTCDSKPGTLQGNLKHFTYDGISDYLSRMNRYSSLAADELVKAGKKPGMISVMLKPLFTFLKMYGIRLGFLEGFLGFQLSALYAVYTLAKYAKARELWHTPQTKDNPVAR